ncbi:hypothetical protein K0M31_007612 [Melipona bicolor]|uniref:Uncharacterized protein n=1 Tax=Melipona bicolor TaxID=60889 RepID=A0AA40GBR0_9HYME|nr:hypothetical protein K0M31_007612 [Melipona bicolor]
MKPSRGKATVLMTGGAAEAAESKPDTYVGSPVELPKIEEPTVEQINEYHRKFIEHVVDFFEKEKYNSSTIY